MTPRHGALDIAAALGQPAPTEEQRAVIEAPPESLLVVAGAGSGKTETMSARVVWLVANDIVLPAEILGLTFTRKAAGELADRIGRRLRQLRERGLWRPDPEQAEAAPTVSTYHAYAGRLVAEHGLRLGHEPGARLLSEASCWQLAHDLVQRYGGPLEEEIRGAGRPVPAVATVVDAVLALAGELAEHLATPAQLDEHLRRVTEAWAALPPGEGTKKAREAAEDALAVLRARRSILPLLRAYQDAKRQQDSLDFADQVSVAARVAQAFPDVGRGERERFRAVLLDEFQDTSEAQLVLLRALFSPPRDAVPVMAVGDPHQSIYGWRGASSTTLASFPQLFPTADGPARTLPLSTSWRNDVAVLDAANVVAAELRERTAVAVGTLAARPGAGKGRVTAARLLTWREEADHVASWVAERIETTGDAAEVPSAAVLCRRRAQFAPMVVALQARGLPVEVVGLGGLLGMPEVNDLVAFLHVVDDPTRGDHLVRLLTGPAVRLGPADLAALHDWARSLGRGAEDEDRLGLVEALDRLPPGGWRSPGGRGLSDDGRARLQDLRARVRRVRDLLSATVPEIVAEAERVLGLDLEVLSRPGASTAEARVHLEALADVASTYASGTDRPTLGGLLAWLAAAEERERGLTPGQVSPTPGAVQVLTVHAAKGLEWDLVAVPGLEEGSFPSHAARVRATDAGWQVPRPRDKAWLSGYDSVPFRLRGDRAGLPPLVWEGCEDLIELSGRIDDFALECGAHALLEERRLGYVALTRARHELLLSTHVWGTQRLPRVTSRFLDELVRAGACTTTTWVPMPPTDPTPDNPTLAEPERVPWPSPDGVRPEVSRAAAAVTAARSGRADGPRRDQGKSDSDPRWAHLDEEIAVLLAERDRAGGRRGAPSIPAHLSTSALVALADDPEAFVLALRRPMPSPPATAARRGTAFHAWIEQHYAQAAIVDLDELPGSADEGVVDEAPLEGMKEHFRESEFAGLTPTEIELAVESTIAGLSVRGRIDAVFPRADGGFTVVDWKTGRRPHGRAAQVRELQLAVYRLAYARLRGLPLDRVDGAFYYAATGETVRPALPDEEALATLVRELTEAQPWDRGPVAPVDASSTARLEEATDGRREAG